MFWLVRVKVSPDVYFFVLDVDLTFQSNQILTITFRWLIVQFRWLLNGFVGNQRIGADTTGTQVNVIE